MSVSRCGADSGGPSLGPKSSQSVWPRGLQPPLSLDGPALGLGPLSDTEHRLRRRVLTHPSSTTEGAGGGKNGVATAGARACPSPSSALCPAVGSPRGPRPSKSFSTVPRSGPSTVSGGAHPRVSGRRKDKSPIEGGACISCHPDPLPPRVPESSGCLPRRGGSQQHLISQGPTTAPAFGNPKG